MQTVRFNLRSVITIVIFLAALTIPASCEKSGEITKPVEEGTCTGIFSVTYLVDMHGSWVGSGSRQTTLELKDGKFTNTGNPDKIPAGGSGNDSIESNKIIFEDLNA